MTSREMWAPRRCAWAGIAALALAVVSACASGGRRVSSAEMKGGAAADGVRVFATGDTRGHVDTCGCESDQFGGLSRRAAYLGRLRRRDDLLVDLGNLTSGTGALRDLRRSATLDALDLLPYDALVPGPAETFDGEKFRQAVRTRARIRVVCANWASADGNLLYEPWLVKTTGDGRRIAFVGLTEKAPDLAPEYSVRPPEDALRDAVRDLAGKADAIVVGAAMSLAAGEALARDVPGVTLVLVGATPDSDKWTEPASGVPFEVAGELGSYVARADLGPDLRVRSVWRAWLDEATGADEGMDAIVRDYKAKVVAIDAGYVEGVVDGHRKAGFAGSDACRQCHQAEWLVWRESLHSHGMRTLVEKKSERDPDCVPCHLVDLPPAGVQATAAAANDLGIGCESCHGASAQHAADAGAGNGKPALTPVRDAKSKCEGCHHPPFVKVFAMDTHWPRIRHGK